MRAPLALGHLRRLAQPVVGEPLAVAHHLARRSSQTEQMSFDALSSGGRLPPGDARDGNGRHVSGKRLHKAIGQIFGPAEGAVMVNKAHAERMNDKGKAVDIGIVGLQAADGRCPFEIGHHVQVGVFVERRIGILAQGGQRRLHRGRRPATQTGRAVQSGHERDHDIHAARLQIGQVGLGGAFHDDDFALEHGRSKVANGANVARDDVGPIKGSLVGSGLAVGLRVKRSVRHVF